MRNHRWAVALMLLLTCPAAVCAAEREAAASGDWSAQATWAGGAVPGDGDTISIADGITVSVSDERVIGPSGDAGSVAIHLNNTGALTIAKGGVLHVRGDVVYTARAANTADAVTIQGGGRWQWDASKTAKPAQTHWRFRPSGEMGFRSFVLDGTAEAPAVLTSEENAAAGCFSRDGKNFAGPFAARHAKISRIGDAKTPGWDISWFVHAKAQEVRWDVQNSLFLDCGLIQLPKVSYMDGTGLFRHSRNVHQGSQAETVFAGLPAMTKREVGGVREIVDNVFDIAAFDATFVEDYTITGNYFGGGGAAYHQSGPWAKGEGNFYRTPYFMWVPGNRFTDSVVMLDVDLINPHVMFPGREPVLAEGAVFSHAATGNEDSGEWFWSTPGPRYCIFLPNAYGYASCEVAASGGGAVGGFILEHNTWFGGWAGGKRTGKTWPGFSAFQYSESGNNKPGDVKSFRSNLMWNPQLPGKEAWFVKMCDIHSLGHDQKDGPPIQDVGNPKDIDYNGSWNCDKDEELDFPNKDHYKNWGKGYIGHWSTTPGEHDVDGDPQFVDYQRDVPLWATKALHKTASRGDWQAKPEKPYTTGDTVLNKTGIYWGLPILYRYIGDGHSNPEPGAGTREKGDKDQWRKSWEWASLYYLRESIGKGEKIEGEMPVMHLIKWIRAGYAPTNPAYKAAAHDGSTIGAVPWREKTK